MFWFLLSDDFNFICSNTVMSNARVFGTRRRARASIPCAMFIEKSIKCIIKIKKNYNFYQTSWINIQSLERVLYSILIIILFNEMQILKVYSMGKSPFKLNFNEWLNSRRSSVTKRVSVYTFIERLHFHWTLARASRRHCSNTN